MTQIVDKSRRRLTAKLAAGCAIAALLALGSFTGSADARAYNHYYNGGYYRSPPIVYGSPYGSSYYGSPYYGGSPYYYAPPLVYGPNIGISLPFIGLGINIR